MQVYCSEFASQGLSVRLFDEDCEQLASDRPSAIALPATTTGRLDLITQVAQDYPFAAIVATVIDPTGLISRGAIDAGACLVLNLLIPAEHTVPVIAQQLLAHLNYSMAEAAPPPPPPTALRPHLDDDTCWLTAILPSTDDDHELVHHLIGGESTSELARRFYCSERSMYRRLRHIYDRVGVSGRYELINRLARWES